MHFLYRALAADGSVRKGLLSASGPDELDRRLQRQGLELLAWRRPWLELRGGAPPRRQLLHFCFHLMQLLQAGLPLIESLADIGEMNRDSRFHPIVAQLLEDVRSGRSLSQAMEAQPTAFDSVFVSLVRAGEMAGDLGQTFATLHRTLSWQERIGAATRRALLYPAIVALTVGACAIFLLLYLVPQLQQVMQTMGVELPAHSRLLFAAAEGLRLGWPLLVVLALLGAAVPLLARRQPGLADFLARLSWRLPLAGPILRNLALARFAHTLGMLYAAGIPLLGALEHSTAGLSNPFLRRALEAAHNAVLNGQGLADAFACHSPFPPLFIRMLHLGERTGRLDHSLGEIAALCQHDAEAAVDQLQRLIEPGLTLFFGVLLGWIALAVISPLQGLIGRIAQ